MSFDDADKHYDHAGQIEIEHRRPMCSRKVYQQDGYATQQKNDAAHDAAMIALGSLWRRAGYDNA